MVRVEPGLLSSRDTNEPPLAGTTLPPARMDALTRINGYPRPPIFLQHSSVIGGLVSVWN